jgi:hypothetical protein
MFARMNKKNDIVIYLLHNTSKQQQHEKINPRNQTHIIRDKQIHSNRNGRNDEQRKS